MILLLAINLTLRLVFPEHKVRQMLSEQVYKASGRSFSVEKLSWSLLGSLDAEGIQVGFTEFEESADSVFFSLEKARVRFSLLPILRRRFQVTEIFIDRPRLFIVPPSGTPADTVQVEPKIQADTIQTEIQPLPVSLALDKLNLENFDLKVAIPDSVLHPEIFISNLNFSVSNLDLPQDFLVDPSGAVATVRFFTRESEIHYKDSQMSVEYNPELEWVFSFEQNKWGLNLESPGYFYPGFVFRSQCNTFR